MSREYFNRRAAIWDEKIVKKDMAKLEQMAERLPIRPGCTVLDVGTGTGAFTPYLSDRIGQSGRLFCLDYAEAMLHRARAKGFRGNISYLQADIMSTPLPEKFFDVVVCHSSFPYFRDKIKALGEIARVLKQGGSLFICHTSSRARINVIHLQIPALQDDLIPDTREMRIMLSATGFGRIQISDESDSFLVSAVKL